MEENTVEEVAVEEAAVEEVAVEEVAVEKVILTAEEKISAFKEYLDKVDAEYKAEMIASETVSKEFKTLSVTSEPKVFEAGRVKVHHKGATHNVLIDEDVLIKVLLKEVDGKIISKVNGTLVLKDGIAHYAATGGMKELKEFKRLTVDFVKACIELEIFEEIIEETEEVAEDISEDTAE